MTDYSTPPPTGAMTRRVAAFLCFLNRESALEGMRILEGLGYHSIELTECIDEADSNTTFVEASKPLSVDFDAHGALDEIQNAIEGLGDCDEASVVGADEKVDWRCGDGGA